MAKRTKSKTYRPRHLGKKSTRPVDKVDLIPWKGQGTTITLDCMEFSSLCPVTAQPDFGEITITYCPKAHIIESKSLKLYLWRYREIGIFSEQLVNEIAADLYKQAKPVWIEVRGDFNSRGGIGITAIARRPAE